ncbi:MAG: hypothetical protein E6Q97_24100 [Desulfurellales bacterium]|nr:MAG: hypothetical protein E6Q97_24100 [Desulfurellales bacterium]
MAKIDLRQRAAEDPDFIAAPRFGDSLRVCLEKRDPPDLDPTQPVPRGIASMLRLSVEEATRLRDKALAEIREELELAE